MATTTSQYRHKGLLSNKNSSKSQLRLPLLPSTNTTTISTAATSTTTTTSNNNNANSESSNNDAAHTNVRAGNRKRFGKNKISIVEKKDLLITGIGTVQPTKAYSREELIPQEEPSNYSKALLQGTMFLFIFDNRLLWHTTMTCKCLTYMYFILSIITNLFKVEFFNYM